MHPVLDLFHPAVAPWFHEILGEPTPPQVYILAVSVLTSGRARGPMPIMPDDIASLRRAILALDATKQRQRYLASLRARLDVLVRAQPERRLARALYMRSSDAWQASRRTRRLVATAECSIWRSSVSLRVQDHAGKPVKGEHWVMQVTATADYIDVAESDIELAWEKAAQLSGGGAQDSPARRTAEDELLWSPREVVLNASRLQGRPPIFRAQNARYPWVFVRSDIVEAMTAAGLTGFRGEDPAERAYSVDGKSLTQVF